eukprot:TRINITY_DN1249_c3_g1_i1.p1 TRINITY_DN1249_c3_g1~~TRINITY_DN1249_c3_g1_i1.p1  ORF type:complete len:197 (+),score=29.60 TRINITY_DN1249_c3_g1_i1:62-592(+)
MDAKMSSMLLIGLTLFGWIFVIVMLAEPKSWFGFKQQNVDSGCGIFNCKYGSGPDNYSGFCSISDYAKASQAFGVMSVLLISLMLVVHLIQALGKGSLIPAAVQPHLRWVHIVAAVFLAILWILMAAWVAKDCYNVVKVQYGVFFGVIVMITEIVCWWLCSAGGAPASSGCQPLIN